MFKKIPGNKDYRISLKLDIIDSNGVPVSLPRDKQGFVSIDMFGKTKRVPLVWVSLMAWYDCGLIEDLRLHLDKIKFLPAWRDLKLRCGHVMQFLEPIYYKDGFRYVPSFPRYAIDVNCNIIDTLENKVITERHEQDGYVQVYIHTPDRCVNKHIRVHRLLALAWLPNIDFINRPIINHIDGNRSNNTLKNLEWCSYSENSKHALLTGLNNQSVKMKSRDAVTGTVEIYNSVSELTFKLGLSKGYSSKSFLERTPGFLFNKRYEIKRADDETAWYYEMHTYESEKVGRRFFDIKVLNKETGDLEIFSKVRDFYKAYGIWGANSLDEAITIFKDRYRNHDINYQRNTLNGPYQVHDLKGMAVTVVKTLEEVAELTGRGKNEIKSDLRRKLKFIYSEQWIIATGIEAIDKTIYRNKPVPYSKILVTKNSDGTVTVARSIKDASRLTGIMPATIDLKIKNGGSVKGFSFRTLE